MHHVRIIAHGADAHALSAIEASVLEAVGECYIYPLARLSRADGYAYGQALEFDCLSPALATRLATDVAHLVGGSVNLTIDGRWFPVIWNNHSIQMDERTSA